MPINMNIEEQIFNKGDEEPPKKKRILTDKQKEALAKGRERAKAIRDSKKSELKEATHNTQEEVKVAKDIKSTQRKIAKKTVERQEAVKKRVHRNANQKAFDDKMFEIAENFDNEKDLEHFQRLCSKLSHEDFKDKATMRAKLADVIYGAIDETFPKKKSK